MTIEGLGQVAVKVTELPRATAFYRDVLGLPFLFETNGMAFFDCGGTRLLLGEPEAGDEDHATSILYYRVTDIRGEHERLAALGVEFVEDPRVVAELGHATLWLAFFRDSEGNVAALMSEVPT
jgi:catechol 2,3-dioxygenase-like lactoylglutathione lyase family enzyme